MTSTRDTEEFLSHQLSRIAFTDDSTARDEVSAPLSQVELPAGLTRLTASEPSHDITADGHPSIARREYGTGEGYSCSLCGKTYARRHNLQQHVAMVHQGTFRPHVCTFEGCDRAFSRSFDLRRHMSSRHEVLSTGSGTVRATRSVADQLGGTFRPHVCTFEGCGRAFYHSFALRRHMSSRHEVLSTGSGTVRATRTVAVGTD
ncbi:hypothetical protein OH77DRAFT_1424346 [Trametes cingulata]|nr:hypothetical protein OH77DRAFT_1424346 [Trametes cingulata]